MGRGGEWTYHGPGQRVVYILLDLTKRGQDVRRFVREVESFAINSLSKLGINSDRREGYPGVGFLLPTRCRHLIKLQQ